MELFFCRVETYKGSMMVAPKSIVPEKSVTSVSMASTRGVEIAMTPKISAVPYAIVKYDTGNWFLIGKPG